MSYDEIVKTLIIFALGIIAAVTSRIVYDWWNRPQIFINNGIDVAKTYYSIFVENKGRSAAINCEAMLTLDIDPAADMIDTKDTKDIEPRLHTGFFREIKDMNLSWARTADGKSCSIAITIYPGARQLLNFYKTDKIKKSTSAELDLAIIIASEYDWDKPRVVLRSNRKYEGEIKIFAENVKYDSKKHKKEFTISKASGDDVEFEFGDNQNRSRIKKLFMCVYACLVKR